MKSRTERIIVVFRGTPLGPTRHCSRPHGTGKLGFMYTDSLAPGARLWGVKVLDERGVGYLSWIIAGVDWVTRNAKHIEVANLSLGCDCSSNALDEAIASERPWVLTLASTPHRLPEIAQSITFTDRPWMSAEGPATWVPCRAGRGSLARPPLRLRPVSGSPSPAIRFIGQAGFVLLGAGLVFAFATTIVHARQETFYIPAYGVGIAAGALCVALIGLALSWRSRRFGLAALTMLAVALGVIGVLTLLSIGIVLLAISLALGSVVATRLAADGGATAAAAGGVLLGLGVPVLAVIAMSGPVVECDLGGARERGNLFLGFESGSGGGEGATSPDGRTTSGRAHGDTYEYTYRCQDGKLIDFDLRHR